MVKAEHIAAWFEARDRTVSSMKLQKLLYYAQAWHLVWERQPLFSERVEPLEVAPSQAIELPIDVVSTLESVRALYGNRSVDFLDQLMIREPPHATHLYGEGKVFSAEYVRGLELMVDTPLDELKALSHRIDGAGFVSSLVRE